MGNPDIMNVELEPEPRQPSVRPVPPVPPPVVPFRPDDDEPELAAFDWLTELAIPLAIFGLLGSLTYYLIDLRAAMGGEFSSLLRWVCFWFLLAAIGITRIRTKYGDAAIAMPYVLGLAAATGLVVYHVTFSSGALAERLTGTGPLVSLVFNYSLVGLIWWLAYVITRNCTLEENYQRSLDAGLFDAEAGAPSDRARHPGRGLLWLSLAAVIVFGLGARAIGDHSRFAHHAFWCMAGYVTCALLLMALTNLSAIRMDTRRRQITISPSLAPTWIGASLSLVLLIAVGSAFLPRPSSMPGRGLEFGPRAGWLRDYNRSSTGQGPAVGLGNIPPDGSTVPGRDAQTRGEGPSAQTGAMGQSGSGGSSTGGQGEADASGGAAGGSSGQSSDASGKGGEGGVGGQGAGGQDGSSSSQAAEQSKDDSAEPLSGRTGSWLLLLILLLLLLAALLTYLAVRYRDRMGPLLRTLTAPLLAFWAAIVSFWERLCAYFSRRRPDPEFADLPEDPFADIWGERDLAANMTHAQVVRHVYRAFLAFCSLRGHARPSHQTEFEFLRTIPPQIGLPEDDRRSLTNTYVAATYSPDETGPEQAEQARDIWSRLRPAIDQALALQAAQRQSSPLIPRTAR